MTRYTYVMLATDIEDMLTQYGGPSEAEALEGLEECDPNSVEGDDLRVLAERVGIALNELRELKAKN
jgi:hypothetical protein